MEKVIGVFIALIFACVIIAILMAYPFMLIWNYAVVAAIDVANPITFWQAFWLSLFCSMFLSGNRASRSEE